MKQYYICPLTSLIMFDPVMADDGYFYESMAINNWLKRHTTSPITEQRISGKIIKAVQFKNMITKYLEDNPHDISNQFLNKKPYYLFRDEFINKLLGNDFHKLTCFIDIPLNDNIQGSTLVKHLLINCTDVDIIKTIIDNSLDYGLPDYKGDYPIHVACRYAEQSIIKHLISKNIDINVFDSSNNKPIHYIAEHQKDNQDIIKYFISNGNNLDHCNMNGLLPIHLASMNLVKWETLKPFLKRDIIETKSVNGMKPIHYACRYNSAEIIDHFLDMKIDIETPVDDNSNKTCEQLIYDNPSITKNEKQRLVFKYLDKVLNKIVIVDGYMNNN